MPRWIVAILIFAIFALIFYKIDFFRDHWILGTVPLWAPAIAIVGACVQILVGLGNYKEAYIISAEKMVCYFDKMMWYIVLLFVALPFVGFVFGFLTYLGWIIIIQNQFMINPLLNLLIPMILCFLAGYATYKFMGRLGRLQNPGVYLFSWNNIPGKDNVRLKNFLKQNYGIHWKEPSKIQKINDGRAINVATGNDFISLRLNDEKNVVNLKVDDGCPDELIAKTVNGKRNIYQDYKRLYDPKTYTVAQIKKFLKLLYLRL